MMTIASELSELSGSLVDTFARVAHLILQLPPPTIPVEVLGRGAAEALYLRQEKLNYEAMLVDFEESGDKWHLSDEHVNPKRKAETRSILENPDRTHYWSTMKGEVRTGFIIAVVGGFDHELNRVSSSNGLDPNEGTEIYKVALSLPL